MKLINRLQKYGEYSSSFDDSTDNVGLTFVKNDFVSNFLMGQILSYNDK